MDNELIAAAGKLTPPAIVSTLTLGGVALSQWVLAATLLYTVLQVVVLAYKFISFIRKGSHAANADPAD